MVLLTEVHCKESSVYGVTPRSDNTEHYIYLYCFFALCPLESNTDHQMRFKKIFGAKHVRALKNAKIRYKRVKFSGKIRIEQYTGLVPC
jgi:hypothetical protein